MGSTNKTTKIGLNQYIGSDYPKREDYNLDMSIIDAVLKQLDEPIIPIYNGRELIITASSVLKTIKLKIDQNVTGGAITIKKNGEVAKSLLLPNGDPVIELLIETTFYLVVEETEAFILAPTGAKLIGNAPPQYVLSGYGYMNAEGEQVGTMSNKTGTVVQGTWVNGDRNNEVEVFVPTGFYPGGEQNLTMLEVNLISANIKAGAKIFNVVGKSTVVDTEDGFIDNTSRIVSGFAGYADGVRYQGTLKNNWDGDHPASTLVSSGNHVYLTIPENARYSPSARIRGYDADFDAANIKDKVSIFGKTGTFTSDADADGGSIMAGKTAYVKGAKVTGTMLKRVSGDYAADYVAKVGNTLKLGIPDSGYYNDAVRIQAVDNDWIESNIKKDVNIFGKLGTYNPSHIESVQFMNEQAVSSPTYRLKNIPVPVDPTRSIVEATWRSAANGTAFVNGITSTVSFHDMVGDKVSCHYLYNESEYPIFDITVTQYRADAVRRKQDKEVTFSAGETNKVNKQFTIPITALYDIEKTKLVLTWRLSDGSAYTVGLTQMKYHLTTNSIIVNVGSTGGSTLDEYIFNVQIVEFW